MVTRTGIGGLSPVAFFDFATLKLAMPNPGIQDSLRDRGVRLTRQRRILLDLIDHSGLHLDAESLYQLAKEKDPKLNRVTVYRSLKLFKEGGLVDEPDLMYHSGDQQYYETRLKQEHRPRYLHALRKNRRNTSASALKRNAQTSGIA